MRMPSSCPCLSHAFWPNSALARRQDAVGIERILDGLMQAAQCVIVEGVGVGNVIHESRMRAVLAPSMLGTYFDDAAEGGAHLPVLFDIVFDREDEQKEERPGIVSARGNDADIGHAHFAQRP